MIPLEAIIFNASYLLFGNVDQNTANHNKLNTTTALELSNCQWTKNDKISKGLIPPYFPIETHNILGNIDNIARDMKKKDTLPTSISIQNYSASQQILIKLSTAIAQGTGGSILNLFELHLQFPRTKKPTTTF